MGVYIVDFRIPPRTTKLAPIKRKLEIEERVITKLMIFIPPGVWGLAGIQIFYGIDQFVPEPRGGWIVGSGESITVDVFWSAPEKPYTITILGYNEDDTYSHTYYIRIIAQPEEVALPYLPMLELTRMLKTILGLK